MEQVKPDTTPSLHNNKESLIYWEVMLMVKSRKRLLTGLAFLIILGGTMFWGPEKATAAPTGTLKWAIHPNLSADWLDPAGVGALGGSAYFTLYMFHDALIKAMPDGLLTPCLAESWTISPDYKIYEFTLRKGVKFHNGDSMTAEDVIFSFSRYSGANGKMIHSKTEKIEAANPYMVRITFKEPFPDFLDYFTIEGSTIGWIVPKKYIEKVGVAGFKKHPIGAGPYKYVDFVAGQILVGEAFVDYWRKIPGIKRMEFRTITDTATRMTMLKRGEVDIATQMTDIYYESAKKDPKIKLISPLSPAKFILSMTAQWDSKSPWSDLRVRQAASLAIDRKTLADIHMPGTNPVGSIGLEGDPMAMDFPPDPYDPNRARKLLAEAGYPNGFHGGKFYPYNSTYRAYGEQLATYWKAVGITVDTVLLERPTWMAMRHSGKLEGGILDDTTSAATISRRMEHLFTSSRNYVNDADVRALREKYQRELNPKTRTELIISLQKLIHAKKMLIPMNQLGSPTAMSQKIKGNPFKIQPMLWFPAPFEDMELIQ